MEMLARRNLHVWTVVSVLCVLIAVVRGQLIAIISTGDTSTYAYGEEVSLTCVAVLGSGVYSFDWLVPDGSTALSRGQNITNGAISQLIFTALEEDSGEYTCRVQSGSEMGSDTITLTIVPAILSGPVDMTLEYSDDLTATFTCSAFGGNNSVLVLSWTHSVGASLNTDTESTTVNPDNSYTSSITTDTLIVEDRGSEYTCYAEYDGSSEVNEATASLSIVPAILERPQSILVGVGLGRNASFTCTAYGGPLDTSPLLIFTWSGPMNVTLDNVDTLEPVNDTVTSVLTLVNVTVDFEGNYSCSVAYNDMPELMSTSEIATLATINCLEQPQDLTAININSRSITLQWVEPHHNNAPVTGYRVMYTEPDFLGGGTVTVNSTDEAVVITGLHSGVEYVFTVIAINAIGESVPSNKERATTLEEVPSNYPQNVMATALSPTETRVLWEEVPAIDQNGEITVYEVQIVPKETFGGQLLTTITVNTSDGSVLMMVLTGLEEYVEYNISVRAYTSAGPGPYSDPITARTETARPDAAPGNVVAVVESSTETKVSWEEVPAIDENGVITMYEIQFVPLETFGGQITSDTVNTSNGSVVMMVLTGLEEYVHYTISVRAYTSAGPGPYSIGVVERTDTDGNIIISDGVIFTLDSDISENFPQFTLTCISTGGPVTTVTWTRDSDTVTEGTETVLDDRVTAQYTHTLTVTGRLGGLYTCTVVNEQLSIATASTFIQVGSAPTNLTAVQEGLTSIRVSWSPPTPLGDTTGYRISYRDSDSSDCVNVSGGSTDNYLLIGLEMEATYTISIVAVSEHLPSDSIDQEVTLGSVPGQPSVSVVSITANSISLSWNVPSDSVVTSSKVTWLELSNDGITSTSGSITDTSYTIERLESTTIYNITVTVTNTFVSTNSHPIIISTVPNIADSCLVATDFMCSQTDNTAAVIGGVVAVVFTIMTALTVIVIAILVLRYRRGNYSTGTKQKGSVDIPVTTNEALELSKLSGEAAYIDPDTIHTSSNEAYQLVKQTGGNDEGYETVTTIRSVPPSSQPTAGDSLYEQV